MRNDSTITPAPNSPRVTHSVEAAASISCLPETILLIQQGKLNGIDPFSVARVTATQSAKNASLLIPYVDHVPVQTVDVRFEFGEAFVRVLLTVSSHHAGGLEVVALTATSIAASTLYDLIRATDPTVEIHTVGLTGVRKNKKENAKDWVRLRKGAVVLFADVARNRGGSATATIIKDRLERFGFEVESNFLVVEGPGSLETTLKRLCDDVGVDLVVTSGGTGTNPGDVTPEVTTRILHKVLPNLSQLVRIKGQRRFSIHSRGVAGVRGKTVIVNLPGTPGGISDSLSALLPWLFKSLPHREEQ